MTKNLFYKSANFKVNIKQGDKKTVLDIQFFNGLINTKEFPHTVPFLTKHTPGVLKTKCFNYDNLAFADEVKETELGHMFEHILLDQLCISKLQRGYKKAVYNGRTYWNWQKNPQGNFKIIVDIGEKEKQIFAEAFDNTIHITEMFMKSNIISKKTSTITKYLTT